VTRATSFVSEAKKLVSKRSAQLARGWSESETPKSLFFGCETDKKLPK
jgi:hypothetical protein